MQLVHRGAEGSEGAWAGGPESFLGSLARHTLAFGFLEAPLYLYRDFLTSAEANLS